MNEEKAYRIELCRNGRSVVYGCFYTTLDLITRAMQGKLKDHSIVNVYSKYGKKVLLSFQG